MLSKDHYLYLQHVLDNVDYIGQFTEGMDLTDYRQNLKTRLAVERCLSIISEAASRLGEQGSILCPTIDWRAIRGLGNRLRHGYDRIDDTVIWDTVEMDLPPLRAAVVAALKERPICSPPDRA